MEDLPDYRHILRQEFEERSARRSRYSLRAFARHLGISPGHLSEVLNRRKALSETMAHRISEKLAWDAERGRLFVGLVRLEAAGSDTQKTSIASELRSTASRAYPFQPIDGEHLSEAFGWMHMAIPDLFGLRNFRPDLRWMASKLRITVVEAEGAVALLRSMGVLEGRGEELRRRLESYVIRRPRLVDSRRIYRKMLDIAREALVRQPPDGAEFGVITMSFDPKRWPEAIRCIRQFQSDMASLSRSGADDAIYQLGLQFVRLDDPDA